MNLRAVTFGLRHIVSPTAGVSSSLVGRILTTPGGIPAFSASLANARAERGVKAAGFITTVQPTAIAGATFLSTEFYLRSISEFLTVIVTKKNSFLAIIAAGEVHGAIIPTTLIRFMIILLSLEQVLKEVSKNKFQN